MLDIRTLVVNYLGLIGEGDVTRREIEELTLEELRRQIEAYREDKSFLKALKEEPRIAVRQPRITTPPD